MRLIILFDHRFYKDKEGRIFSLQNYNYPLFQSRYLQVFDEIVMLTRVASQIAENPQNRSTTAPNLKIISIGDWNNPLLFFARSISIFRTIYSVLKTHATNPSAVLMFVPGLSGALSVPYLRWKKIPFAIEIVGDPYDAYAPGGIASPIRPILRWAFSRMQKAQARYAAAIQYVTNYTLQKRYPPNPDGFTIGCSDVTLPAEAYVANARSITDPKSHYQILCIGSLAQMYKAPDILLQAIKYCREEGIDVTLRYVGEGKFRPSVESLAVSLGLEKEAIFIGQLPAGEAIRNELDRADLFILPSRTEGLPRTLVEAMARALPCIGTNVGGIPELLSPENLVPADDARALADKIMEVLRSPQRMAEMSAQNFVKAEEYQFAKLQLKRLEFYNHLKQTTSEFLDHKKGRSGIVSDDKSSNRGVSH